jgi:hypothetical protein
VQVLKGLALPRASRFGEITPAGKRGSLAAVLVFSAHAEAKNKLFQHPNANSMSFRAILPPGT